jgi:hypothetical protein
LPARAIAAGESYELYARDDSSGTFMDSYFPTAANKSISLPAAIATPMVSGNPAYPTISWLNYPGAQLYRIRDYPSLGAFSDLCTIYLTPQWIAAHQGIDSYTVPDLSALAGWDSAWNVNAASSSAVADIEAVSSNSSLQQLMAYLANQRAAGLTVHGAYGAVPSINAAYRRRMVAPFFRQQIHAPRHAAFLSGDIKR